VNGTIRHDGGVLDRASGSSGRSRSTAWATARTRSRTPSSSPAVSPRRVMNRV